jgi:outer membrane protein OmpA-like peptidoglycan-associated protein
MRNNFCKSTGLFFILLITIQLTFGQDVESVIKHNTEEDYLEVANKLFRNNMYYEAINYFEESLRIKEHRKNPEVWDKLATCYSKTRLYKEAEEAWLKAYRVFNFRKPEFVFKAVEEQIRQEKYEDAINNCRELKKKYPFETDNFLSKTDSLFERAKSLRAKKESELRFSYYPIPSPINNFYSSISPAFYNDTLFFSSTVRKKESTKLYLDSLKGKYNYSFFQNMFFAVLSEEDENIFRIKFVDDKVSSDYFSFSKETGNKFWFTNCIRTDTSKCRICYGYLRGNRIYEITCPEEFSSSTGKSYKHPCFTKFKNEDYLFFSSNREGGYGGFDIYYKKLTEGGLIKNAGKYVNSSQDEITPFFSENKRRLFYSTEDKEGFGGFDVLESPGNPAFGFYSPRNVGYGINSGADDYYYFPISDKDIKAYISSNREVSAKSTLFDKIFAITDYTPDDFNKKATFIFSLSDSIESLDGKISVYSADSSELHSVDFNNNSEVKLKFNSDKKYYLYADAEGYLPYFSELNYNENDIKRKSIEINIPLIKIEKGAKIILANIYFEEGEHILLPESYEQLNKITSFLKNNPLLRIEISGHTDNIGSFEYNKKLSELRAIAVQEYLFAKGVKKHRLEARGYSYKRPIADNSTFEGRAANRRVEFEVIKD